MRIAVCVKQVPDPDTPTSAFNVDEAAGIVIPAPGIPPVVNGFDLHAVEAALRIKDRIAEARVSVLSVGSGFVLDAMKKPLAMGADELTLLDDPVAGDLDGVATAKALRLLVERTGPYELILCGRQASDWDQAFVPLGLAELLNLPCVTLARSVEVSGEEYGGTVRIERTLADGYQIVEVPMPVVVTVSNELGEARFATLRGIMAATKTTPSRYSMADLGIEVETLTPELRLRRLFVPESDRECEVIEGEDEDDAGRRLAIKLHEAGLI